MRLLPLTLSALLLSSAVAIAQTGFTLKTYPASPRETTVRVADFNHDGNPDLLVYGPSQSNLHLYLNNGSGGFSAPKAIPVTYGQVIIAKVADLNGDGFPDIVACTATPAGTGFSDSVVTYLNDGNGNFTPTIQSTPLPGQCSSLVVGDVNLDGHQDVVVGSYVNSGSPSLPTYQNYLQTYFGDGTGKLSAAVTQSNINLDIPTTDGDTNCRIDDISGGNFYLDNQLSLFVTSNCAPGYGTPQDFGTIFLAHGDGTGHFTFTPSNASPQNVSLSQTLDLNLDGRPDVVFASAMGYGNPTGLYSAINNGSGNLTYHQLATNPSYGYYGIASADFNGDRIPDLVTTSDTEGDRYAGGAAGPALINFFNGSSSGTYTQSQSISIGNVNTGIRGIVAADFNGDGSPDLATLVVDESNYTYATQLYVYSSSHACTAPTKANSNIICSPANGASSSSPVTVTAASNVTGLTLNRLYLDNKSVYQTTAATVSTSLPVSSGSHRLVLVSYNNQGQAFTSASTFTVGSGSGACSQSTAGATICAPAAGSTANSPVTITAAAMASAGNITAIRAYIDNNTVFTVNNPAAANHQQVSQSVSVGPGAHYLVIIGYQSNGSYVKTSENFTVSGSTPCYPSSAGASICSPSNGSTTASPFNVTAGATAGSGYITAIRVYVDSVAKTLINNPQKSKSFAINSSITEPAGKHNIVVVGYQSTGGSVSASSNVTVQ